jgi:hypothetical protein
LICVVTVVLAAGVLLPMLTRPKNGGKHPRIACISNLKQIGLAFRMWSNDHGEKFPWSVTAEGTNGGSMEFNLTGEVWRHFQTISNELNTPKVLVCPVDSQNRQKVADWQSFTNNSHLSYFVGLDADETKPQSILTGDRNLTATIKPVRGVLNLTAKDRLEWTKDIHKEQGNVALGDGSALQMTTHNLNMQLQSAFAYATQAVHRLALPE